MDYTAVNTPEIRFTRGNAQIRDSDSINVTTLTDGDDEEEETFYLNFNPTRSALFIPPRIEIKICGSKHKTFLLFMLYYNCMQDIDCSPIVLKLLITYMFTYCLALLSIHAGQLQMLLCV